MAIATSTLAAAAIVGIGAATATTQIMAGREQAKNIKREGEYNAQVMEQQATMIESRKKIEEYQYNRAAARMRVAIVARTGKAGFNLSGSPLALLVDSETQIQLDKNIGQYNLEVQKRYALSGAQYYRGTASEQARLAKFKGYSNAFSTVLGTTTSVFRAGKL